MKNWFRNIATGVALLATVSACKKDEAQMVLSVNAAPQLTASATTATLTKATASSPAATYTWTKADYGYQAATTYTLQFAKKGTNFAMPINIDAGPALSKTLTVEELNAVYGSLDCNAAGVSAQLDVRVKASVSDKTTAQMSNMGSITATPYQAQTPPADTWAIIGSATPGGWGTETAMTYNYCKRVWTITIQLTKEEFKFRANNGWAVNLGDDGADGKLEANGANIMSPGVGLYDVTLDMTATPKPTYTIKLH